MPKKNQTLICSLLFMGAVFLGLMFLEGGRAKTLSDAQDGSSVGAMADPEGPTVQAQVTHPALTLTSSRTVTRLDGQTRLLSTLQRFQRSDGVFKTVLTNFTPGGGIERVQTHFGFIGLGVFRLDMTRRRLIFTGPQVDDAVGDVEQFLRGNPLFTRAESLRGMTTIVWRKPGRSEENFVEEFRAPALGGLLVKRIKVSPAQRETEEPTAIEMGEPPLGLFSELFSLQADYSQYERRVVQLERRAETEAASLMRQLLERMRQIRPGASSEH